MDEIIVVVAEVYGWDEDLPVDLDVRTITKCWPTHVEIEKVGTARRIKGNLAEITIRSQYATEFYHISEYKSLLPFVHPSGIDIGRIKEKMMEKMRQEEK